MESKNTAPGGQDQERIVSEFGNTKEMEREHPFCGAYLLEHISAVINMACRHGGGAVVELKDMAEPDLSWTMGLCRAMADAGAQYIGCADGEKPGVCAVMCQRCQKENAGHLEPICTGKKTCTRF